MKGYKVCAVISDSLLSATCLGLRINYKKDKWVKRPPNCGPLAVFKNKKQAFSFSEGRQGYEVFKCKYKKSKEKKLYFYDNIKQKKITNFLVSLLPTGTILADKVKILEKCGMD